MNQKQLDALYDKMRNAILANQNTFKYLGDDLNMSVEYYLDDVFTLGNAVLAKYEKMTDAEIVADFIESGGLM